MSDDIVLSICCLTYNHEKYVNEAIESMINQVVNYKCEIIISEDYSKDKTKEILQSKEKALIDRFHTVTILYHDENKGICYSFNDVVNRAKGKYVIVFELDDVWTDNTKLQTELEILEKSSYIAVAHRCKVIDEYSKLVMFSYPDSKAEEYKWRQYRRNILPGQTATLMYRNIFKEKHISKSIFYDNIIPIDRIIIFILMSYGKIFCIQKEMSSYRYVPKSGDSYSARLNNRTFSDSSIKLCKALCAYANENQLSEEAVYTAEAVYIVKIINGILRNESSYKVLLAEFALIKHKFRCALFASERAAYNIYRGIIQNLFRNNN